jgi:hypothetical protein
MFQTNFHCHDLLPRRFSILGRLLAGYSQRRTLPE